MKEDEIELYALYGRFFVEYETVCSWMRHVILKLMFPDFQLRERNVTEILLEGLTADPLKKKMLALVAEYHSSKSDIFKVAKKISNKMDVYVPLRNSFAHGRVFIGLHDFIIETKDDEVAIRHPKIRSEGLDINFQNFKKEDLKILVADLCLIVQAMRNLVILVSHCDKEKSFTKKFLVEIDLYLADTKFKT